MHVYIFCEILVCILSVIVLIASDAGIGQYSTVLIDALCVFLMELGFDIAFGIRFLVIFLTLDSSVQRVDKCCIESDRVNRFLLTVTHLLDSLVGGNGSVLMLDFHHSKVNEFVVGCSLLLIICELGQV